MRKLSESINVPVTAINLAENPGNGLNRGLSNHYTPIDNIISNVRNLFGSLLGLVVRKGEDGTSLKIQSSNFTTPEVTSSILFNSTFDGRTYLHSYIIQQGLTGFNIVNIGNYCIVYYFAENVAKDVAECKEIREYNLLDCEMETVIKEDNQEVELEDKTKEELAEIINNNNKVKAAADFADKLSSVVTLPEDMYIKATKDVDGHESISLRYKTTKRRPFGGKVDNVVSLMNIYCTGTDAVWVDAYLNKEQYNDDILNVIDSVLQFIGAEKTDDEAVWTIPDAVESTEKQTTTETIDNANTEDTVNNTTDNNNQ
jgi:hypothetical protein